VIDHQQSDFLSLFMGWLLCASTFGWSHADEYCNSPPPPQHGIEDPTFELWRTLLLLYKIVNQHCQSFPQMEAVRTLEILRWAYLLYNIVTGKVTPDLEDSGSNGWLDYLGIGMVKCSSGQI
jgi:hypothetical protein